MVRVSGAAPAGLQGARWGAGPGGCQHLCSRPISVQSVAGYPEDEAERVCVTRTQDTWAQNRCLCRPTWDLRKAVPLLRPRVLTCEMARWSQVPLSTLCLRAEFHAHHSFVSSVIHQTFTGHLLCTEHCLVSENKRVISKPDFQNSLPFRAWGSQYRLNRHIRVQVCPVKAVRQRKGRAVVG